MPVHTRRWNDQAEPGDGLRVLVTRYRPRAVRKDAETWDRWEKQLGPSAELLAAFQGKRGAPISWAVFRRRYLAEVTLQVELLDELAARIRAGEAITLLCSRTCEDPERCHRTPLAELLLTRD